VLNSYQGPQLTQGLLANGWRGAAPLHCVSSRKGTAVVGERIYSDHLHRDKRSACCEGKRWDRDSTILCQPARAALGSSPWGVPSSKTQEQRSPKRCPERPAARLGPCSNATTS